MKFNVQSLLKDKNVLYVTLFIAITNMFAYLMFRQFDAVIFFVIVSVITSHFSKNMIIILLAAILSTNFAVSVKVIGKVKEGMTNKDDDKKAVPKKEDTKKKDTKKKDVRDILNMPKPVESKNKNSKKQGFTQQLNPARINAADGDDDEDYDSQPTVDYASTLESAYDNLDKLLSSDAINNMSEDTHRLAEKQQLLMGNIEKMTPIMEKAGSLLGNFDMSAITKLMGTVSKGIKDVDMSSLTSEVADNAEEVVKK